MIPIPDSEAAADARYEIERALLGGARWELFVGDSPAGSVDRSNSEFNVEWGKLIFAWWGEAHSQSWRVIAWEQSEAELRLQATRGMGRETAILTLRDPVRWRELQQTENLSLEERRNNYAQLLARLIAAKFDGARIERATTGTDRARQLTGRYARLVVRRAAETILAIGACEAELQTEIDGIVATGIVWLTRFNEGRDAKTQARALAFCLPRDRSQTAIERLTLVDATALDARIECFEVDERREDLMAVQVATQQELLSTHPRNVLWPRQPVTDEHWRERILSLAPGLIEARNLPGHDGESFAIQGLEFARVVGGEKRQVKFGVAGLTEDPGTLTESSFADLERLAREILRFRSADSTDRRHPFYRLREEAWLESMLRRDICTLDVRFDERFVYSQIPAWRGDERSVIDLLTVDREGRLAVVEVKASEDGQLPMQGTDYWLRVEQARLRGEFARRGLFSGVTIADQPPVLYLVAPRLRFHRTFAMIARCLSRQVDAWRIGINANWREGVRIRSRERVNPGGAVETP